MKTVEQHAEENVYEDIAVAGEDQMKTMDIRIKITNDIIKESEEFHKTVDNNSEDIDKEHHVNKAPEEDNTIVKNKYDFRTKMKGLKRKCLTRISNLKIN